MPYLPAPGEGDCSPFCLIAHCLQQRCSACAVLIPFLLVLTAIKHAALNLNDLQSSSACEFSSLGAMQLTRLSGVEGAPFSKSSKARLAARGLRGVHLDRRRCRGQGQNVSFPNLPCSRLADCGLVQAPAQKAGLENLHCQIISWLCRLLSFLVQYKHHYGNRIILSHCKRPHANEIHMQIIVL